MGDKLDTLLKDLLSFDELELPLRPPYDGKEKEEALKKAETHYEQITVGQLLSHTAGLGRAHPLEGSPPGTEGRETKMGEYGYSNYGFQLLARIIGKHFSKKSGDHEACFRQYIEERIFRPAGMHCAISPSQLPQRFDLEEDGPKAISDEEPDPYPHGNGCWTMTAHDLMLFGQALRSHKLISQQALLQMLQHEPPLGFMVDRNREGEIVGYGHPGGGPGQSAFFHTWLTHPPITAVVLSNYPTGADVKLWLDSQIPELIQH